MIIDRDVEWEYLMWLSAQAGFDPLSEESIFWHLLLQLFNKEFSWVVPNDDNRANDGLYLREVFSNEFGGNIEFATGVNMLELMVGLAYRLGFEMSDESEDPAYWFAILLTNTGLDRFHDKRYLADFASASHVDNILNRIINRDYDADGYGGFFPLQRPEEDQRGLELWGQLNSYILERTGN